MLMKYKETELSCGSCYGSPSLCPALEQKAIKIYLKLKQQKTKKAGGDKKRMVHKDILVCIHTWIICIPAQT